MPIAPLARISLRLEEVATLLAALEDLHRDDVGVRFHNGVRCCNRSRTIALARNLEQSVDAGRWPLFQLAVPGKFR